MSISRRSGDDSARAHTGIALGDALTTLVDYMHGEGVTGKQVGVLAVEVGVKAQQAVRNRNLRRGQLDT